MGDSDEIADLHVAGDSEAQEILHPRSAEGLRGQPRAEKRGQASRLTAHRNSLRAEARTFIPFILFTP